MAYPEGHPYRHPTIGFMEDLDAASLEQVREFFRTFYRPDNAVLALVGDVESERGFELADRYFGSIPRGPGSPQVTAPPVDPGDEVREIMRDRVQFPRLYLFHHAPAFGQNGFEAADALTCLLADGKSSRLYRKLVYEGRIAQDVSAAVYPTEDCGLCFIVATARPGVEAMALETAILESLEDLREEMPTESEVEGAVNRSARGLVATLNGVGGRSDAIATSATFLGRPGYVNELFGRMRSVTPEAVQEVARSWLVADRRATLHVLPRETSGGGE
jgi:zinc protease